MDSWLYGIPANSEPPPPQLPPPPPSIQGSVRFICICKCQQFGITPPQFIPENNAFGPHVEETPVISPNDGSVDSVREGIKRNRREPGDEKSSVHKRRREIKSHPEIAVFPDISAETVLNTASPTPRSQRRRTGCNCKTSMCQNGHCFCFRENAGCSDGCGCNDCRNSFNTGQGTSNGNSADWEKQKSAIVALLMEESETDFADNAMIEQYCKTLEELLVTETETNGESQRIDRDGASDKFTEEHAQSSLTDTNEAKP